MTSNKWETFKLDEVYEIRSGLSKKRDQFGFGYNFLTFKEVFNNYFLPNELTELVNSTEQEREKASIMRGDVFLTRTSETQDELGMSSVALKDYPNATFNGFTKRLRPKGNIELLPEYAGYYFRSPKFRNEVTSLATLTTRASLNNTMLSSLTIDVPPVQQQKEIANILSSLDDKIENNNAIIANLEEQAQAVFKETLNNYNFTQVKLNTLIDIYSGFAFKSKDYLPGGTHKIITIKNIEDGKINETNVNKIDNIPDNIKDEAFLRIGDIVFSMTGNVGRTALIYKKGLLLNQRVGKILFDNTDYISFYYFLFRNISFKQRLIDLAHGTAQANLGKMDTLNLEIPYNKKAMANFSDIFNPVVNKIINLMRQNDKLIEVRETLLPKLMSGEIQVGEAIEVE